MGINTKALFEAKQSLNKFLSEHGELKPFQDAIDKIMASAGSPENRRLLIQNLFEETLKKLEAAANELQELIKKLPLPESEDTWKTP